MPSTKPPATLVFIVGPAAVGKMTVGHELARRTGLKLVHNHHAIDLALEFFPFGTPPFHRSPPRGNDCWTTTRSTS